MPADPVDSQSSHVSTRVPPHVASVQLYPPAAAFSVDVVLLLTQCSSSACKARRSCSQSTSHRAAPNTAIMEDVVTLFRCKCCDPRTSGPCNLAAQQLPSRAGTGRCRMPAGCMCSREATTVLRSVVTVSARGAAQ